MSLLPNEQANGEGGQGANPGTSNPQGEPWEVELSKARSDIERISKMVGAMQSDKDKAAFRAEQTANSAIGQIANIAKYLGVSPEQVQEAQRRSVLDDLVSQKIGSESNSAGPVGTGTQGNALERLTGIDSALGLPSNDPRVTNLKLLYASDPDAYLKNGLVLRDSLKSQSPPTPAEQPLPSGNVEKTSTPTMTALQNEYEEKRNEIMNDASLVHKLRVEKLTELKAVMRNKGLPIR